MKRHQRGFTLLEVTVALVITASAWRCRTTCSNTALACYARENCKPALPSSSTGQLQTRLAVN